MKKIGLGASLAPLGSANALKGGKRFNNRAVANLGHVFPLYG